MDDTTPTLPAALAAEHGEYDAQLMTSAYLLAGELTDDEVGELAQLDGVRRMEYLTDRYPDANAYTAAYMDFLIRDGRVVTGRLAGWTSLSDAARTALRESRCAYSLKISGSSKWGRCEGSIELLEFEPLSRKCDPNNPKRVYLCDGHRTPATRGDRVVRPQQLPPDHPVLIWDAVLDSVRGESWTPPYSDRYLRIQAAERAALGLLPDAPGARVREAEGRDARLTYRWSLSYLRAYAALLTGTDLDDVDLRAAGIRIERHRLSVTQGEVSVFHHGDLVGRFGDDIRLCTDKRHDHNHDGSVCVGGWRGHGNQYWVAVVFDDAARKLQAAVKEMLAGGTGGK